MPPYPSPASYRAGFPEWWGRRPARTSRIIAEDTSQWSASTLSGPQLCRMGETMFALPAHARVKVLSRTGTAWVLVDDRVHVISDLGELILSEKSQRELAETWHIL